MTTAQAWREFTRNLADCIDGLEEDEFLFVSYKDANYFVQFAGQGWYGVRAEASSNAFIEPPEALLTQGQYRQMAKLGWNRATDPNEPVGGDGSPNFFVDVPRAHDHTALARMASRTLRRVFGIAHPGMLQYLAFHSSGASIRFPTLRLHRNTATTTSCVSLDS